MKMTKNIDKKTVINEKVLIFLSPSYEVNKQSFDFLSDKEKKHSEIYCNLYEFSKIYKLDDLFTYGTIYFFGGDVKTFNKLINLLVKYSVSRNVNQSDANSFKDKLRTLPKDKGFVIKHTGRRKK